MKSKVFIDKTAPGLEEKINDFLKDKNLGIISVTQSESKDFITLTIIYNEEMIDDRM